MVTLNVVTWLWKISFIHKGRMWWTFVYLSFSTVIDIWPILLYICIPLHLPSCPCKKMLDIIYCVFPLTVTTKNIPFYFQNIVLAIMLSSIESHFCRALVSVRHWGKMWFFEFLYHPEVSWLWQWSKKT